MSASHECVAGSVTGRDHLRARRDGQDGFAIVEAPRVTAAIVTDGCSSGAASEIGARLGARWLARLVAREFPADDSPAAARRVAAGLEAELEALARSLAAAREVEPAIVGDVLLFGWLAAVVAPPKVIVFGVGDGLAWIDGRAIVIDPGPDNAPPYTAYGLLGAESVRAPRILFVGASADVERLAIATDGAEELLRDGGAAFDALVRDDRCFANRSLLRKRLLVLEDRGACFDDTTIAIVRRRP